MDEKDKIIASLREQLQKESSKTSALEQEVALLKNRKEESNQPIDISKQILLEELEEQGRPERVEDVIFWALEYYHKHNSETWGSIIANYIIERIKSAEKG